MGKIACIEPIHGGLHLKLILQKDTAIVMHLKDKNTFDVTVFVFVKTKT